MKINKKKYIFNMHNIFNIKYVNFIIIKNKNRFII